MKVSQNGVDLIKEFEGLRTHAYLDIAAIPTIGYGHTGPEVKMGMVITAEKAEQILKADIAKFEEGVMEAVRVVITQNQFDALVSLAFNIGVGAFKKSTAVRRLNKNNYTGCAEAMQWWNKVTIQGELRVSTGLARRREAEAKLFLTPANDNDRINTNDGVVKEPGMSAIDDFEWPQVLSTWMFDRSKEDILEWLP